MSRRFSPKSVRPRCSRSTAESPRRRRAQSCDHGPDMVQEIPRAAAVGGLHGACRVPCRGLRDRPGLVNVGDRPRSFRLAATGDRTPHLSNRHPNRPRADSDGCRPLIPAHAVHGFRFMPSIHSDADAVHPFRRMPSTSMRPRSGAWDVSARESSGQGGCWMT